MSGAKMPRGVADEAVATKLIVSCLALFSMTFASFNLFSLILLSRFNTHTHTFLPLPPPVRTQVASLYFLRFVVPSVVSPFAFGVVDVVWH